MTVNPPVIALGESAQIKVEIRDGRRPQAPDFPTVDGLRFSGISQSHNSSWINGKVDKSVSYTVTAYPQRTGEFKIGPFNYTVDKKSHSLTGTLNVVPTSGDTARAQSWNDVSFVRVESSREQAYVQEPFDLTLSIYSRTDIQLGRKVNLSGFPETGLTDPEWKETGTTREQVDGVLYNVRRFRSPFRAMGAGQFVFAPTVTVQVVAPQQQRRRNDLFGGFGLFDSVQTIPVELKARPSVVNVLPLPASGKPAGFSGAVGRFQFQVTADPKEVHPGDPITLQMTILGEGNYDRILPPALPDDAPFRLFGDAVRQQGSNGVRFEQVISPRDADVTEIPPIAFSFFDSRTGQYNTVKSAAIPISVTPSSNDSAQIFAASNTQVIAPANQPFASESDIQRFLGWLKNSWETIRPWLWILPVALVLGILVFISRKLYRWRRKDTARIRRQQAPKAARKALKEADAALRKNNTAAFYEALGNALNDYFGHRLNLPPGEVTSAMVLQTLNRSNLDTTLIQSIFDQVEAARYGMQTTQSTKDMKQLRSDLGQSLKLIEKSRAV